MSLGLQILVSLVSIAIVGFYTWSLRGHFSSAQMAPGAKTISAAVAATTVLLLDLTWTETRPPFFQLIGVGIELAAACLFWWAISVSRSARLRFAFDPEHPDSIVMTGPYRYLRHPFYTSYLIFWSGWGIATWSIWAIVPVIFFTVVYVLAAKDEERKFSLSPLAIEYDVYRKNTGFLAPRLWRY